MRRVALAGNPNSGKTTLFNALTGLRQKVANYPGVTVERKTGRCRLADGDEVEVIDLPGTYSLVPHSPDEAIAAAVLNGQRADTPAPDVVVAVVDASNLARNLFLVSQLVELGRPMVVALTMVEVARARGLGVDPARLATRLGLPVVPVCCATGEGVAELRAAIPTAVLAPRPLFDVGSIPPTDAEQTDIEARYRWIDSIVAEVRTGAGVERTTTERVDAVLMHPLFGLAIFALIMGLLFVAVFYVSAPMMDALEGLVLALGGWIGSLLPEGLFRSLVVDGLFAGVGGVVIFVPQIAMLFLFLAVLEDSGYLARAAFLMDRLLAKVGLHGKSFVPLLSSFACAIPGIMATRAIDNWRERLATILVAPFMSCSARLPVYGLLIGSFFATSGALVQGGIMLACYILGIVAAALSAWVASKLLGRGPESAFVLELPTYQLPRLGSVALQIGRACSEFLLRAGGIILALSIVLWAATTFPKLDEQERAAASTRIGATIAGDAPDRDARIERAVQAAELEHSLAGRLGHALEPAIAPLGYDWKIGVGLVAAFAAREVFVSTMGIVYSVAAEDGDDTPLRSAMLADRHADGRPVWTPAVAISLLVWFVLAMQCLSTVAVVHRETGGWRWPLIQLAYMNGLAWVGAFVAYRLALLAGLS